MDPGLLKNITLELDTLLNGGIVSKIHEPDERNLILKIFVKGREEKLIISTHPKFSRMHLTESRFGNPPVPKRFCAFLRSRILNSRIESVSVLPGERIAKIELRKKDGERLTLAAELTGKSANIILLDDKGVILDALRYFSPEESPRAVMPGIGLKPLEFRPKAGPREDRVQREPGVGDMTKCISWNGAADRHYSSLLEEERFLAEAGRLKRVMTEAGKKIKRKIENLLNDRTRAELELDYTRLGELIVYNLGKIKRGMKEAEIDDYTTVPPRKVRVPLDEKLGPGENAEKFFKRAKKAKVAIEILKERIPACEKELEYAGDLAYELESAKTIEDLQAAEEELIDAGYIKKAVFAKRRAPETEPVRRFNSSEGFEILCGKSGRGNDLIVKKYARDEDIWFHASAVPGSHVLIKTAGRKKDVTDKTVEEAASIAAWHSRNQGASKAEVIYTEAKNVNKPKCAKPGMVTVKNYRTVIVKPGLPAE